MAVATFVALTAALSASPALAFDPHFRVLTKIRSFHERDRVEHFTATLLNPRAGHHRERVGHSRTRCRELPRKLKCRVVVHLNGRIGGRGDIKARGDISHRDNRLNVVGGMGGFNGVAGKVLVHPAHWHFDLTR